MQLPVNRGARDPVVADDPEREGRAEPDLVPLRVHLQDIALNPPPPAPDPAGELLAGRRRAVRPAVGMAVFPAALRSWPGRLGLGWNRIGGWLFSSYNQKV